MKHLALSFLPLCLLIATLPAAKASKPPQFNSIVVDHFTNASGMSQSQEFIREFSEGFRNELRTWKLTQQVLDESATVTDADAVNSLVIEGRFTGLDNGAIFTKLQVEIDIYRVSDHVLVKTVHENSSRHGDDLGDTFGTVMAEYVAMALKRVDLSAIPAGPPVPRPATPTAPATAIATPAAPVFASVQLSSNPAGAEITIDGAYAGNTPSVIKLRPGTHSIRIAKDGYTPWEQSIETGAGETRNLAPNLEKTTP